MNPETVLIVIIGYNIPKMESDCISSVIRHTKHPYSIIYFDNFESGMTLTEVWNRIIQNGGYKYICLLNSDTLVSEGWLGKLVETLNSDESYGFVGPSTNNCHGPQSSIASYDDAQNYKGEYEVTKDPISGFCLLFNRLIWLNLGGFDEKYKFYGQESAFIRKAQTKLGVKCVWRKDSFVYHIGEASVKKWHKNAKEEREIAKKLYWGDVKAGKI